jgi:methylmalonyl-CoA mutase
MRDHPPPTRLNAFEPATYEAWLKLAERDLAGAPFEKRLVKRVSGIDIRPLYIHKDELPEAAGAPGASPFTRGSTALGASEAGWDVRQEVTNTDPVVAGAAVLDDRNGGATSVALVFDGAIRRGVPGKAAGIDDQGIAAGALQDLATVLASVPLDETPVMLFAGASVLPVSAGLFALAARRRVKPASLSGCLGADPLGTLASEGALPTSLEGALAEAVDLARWTAAQAPNLRAILVDASPYHDAAADAATEVGVALATGVAYLRALSAAGFSVDAAAAQIAFSFSVGRDFFVEVAKLRAARWTWAKVLGACGATSETAPAMALHARTSRRTKAQRDPWVNLLRGTAETFSAVVGGAEAVTTAGFDAALGEGDELGRRLARNTQNILRDESNIHRVVDPAGGSWYVEAITDGLARRAWEKLQAIERAGGMAAVLASGDLQAELDAALEAERKAVETRKTPITGVNEFPNVHEASLDRPSTMPASSAEGVPLPRFAAGAAPGALVEQVTRAVADGARFLDVRAALDRGTPARVRPLVRERLSRPFEVLRDRADAAAGKGARPAAFLANLGPIAEHKARAAYAQNLFEAGGFAVVTNDGFATADAAAAAFARSAAAIAVLCSSDAVYAELAKPAAQALRAQGARAVVLAGAPGDAEPGYREAGVTDFVFVGVNAAASLRSLLDRAGA